MQEGLLGRKIGMTQIFDEAGNHVPVTVIQAGPNTVVRKKTSATDGYSAIVVGFEAAEPRPTEADRLIKPQRRWLNRPMTEFFKKSFKEAGEAKFFKILREIRLPEPKIDLMDIGEEIKVDLFNAGEFVDVIGTSKGHGFAGGMVKHHWKGMSASHGTHEYFRHGGAVSSNTFPGRLFPGRRMPGQMGNAQVTAQNLKLVATDPTRNLIFIRGAVPGSNGGLVFVQKAKKKQGKK
jgi:large subunit ribosomal protein L3